MKYYKVEYYVEKEYVDKEGIDKLAPFKEDVLADFKVIETEKTIYSYMFNEGALLPEDFNQTKND